MEGSLGRLQKLPKNVSLSLAKGKLDEKNEWKFSNQSGEVMHASIYLTNRRKSFFFFRLPYLEYDFMIANIVRLNLAVLKYRRRPRNIPVVEYYVSKVAGIHSPI